MPRKRKENPAKPDDRMQPNHAIQVQQVPEETGARAMARTMLRPEMKNAAAAAAYTKTMLGDDLEKPGIGDFIGHVQAETSKASDGDITAVSKMLMAQAITLDSMFAELARRAALNMGQHIPAAEKYGRLALKAQSNCRATLEALAKLHQPAKEQIVRHIHVNEGGQAIIADQVNSYTGVPQNAEYARQSDATRYPGGSPALRRPDPLGQALPIASREGQETVPDARGH